MRPIEKRGGFQPEARGPAPTKPPPKRSDAYRSAVPDLTRETRCAAAEAVVREQRASVEVPSWRDLTHLQKVVMGEDPSGFEPHAGVNPEAVVEGFRRA